MYVAKYHGYTLVYASKELIEERAKRIGFAFLIYQLHKVYQLQRNGMRFSENERLAF